jgi:hypothetical protein
MALHEFESLRAERDKPPIRLCVGAHSQASHTLGIHPVNNVRTVWWCDLSVLKPSFLWHISQFIRQATGHLGMVQPQDSGHLVRVLIKLHFVSKWYTTSMLCGRFVQNSRGRYCEKSTNVFSVQRQILLPMQVCHAAEACQAVETISLGVVGNYCVHNGSGCGGPCEP